jgi:hypothetical protein
MITTHETRYGSEPTAVFILWFDKFEQMTHNVCA